MKVFFVNNRLAFGSAIKTLRDVERLRALGVTHIINLRWSQNNSKVRQFSHIWLRFHDDKKPRLGWFYRRARNFYFRSVTKPKAKVLVMCHHGISRSASMAYFLLRAGGTQSQEAEASVFQARKSAKICRAYRDSSEEFLKSLR